MLYDASARAVIAVAWGQKGECMRSIILSWVLLLGLGCSSDAVDTVGNQSGQGPNGGKADNLDNTDGGVIETDGEVIATGFDGGAPDTGEDLSDSEPVEVDPFASAWDVNAHRIEFPEGTEALVIARLRRLDLVLAEQSFGSGLRGITQLIAITRGPIRPTLHVCERATL